MTESDKRPSRQVSYTRYDGDPDQWEYGDPYVGHGVPNRIRKGGATNPMEKKSLGGNGVSYRSHSVAFECDNCGHVQRYATSDFQTMGHCRGCGDTQLFKFDFGRDDSSTEPEGSE